MQREVIIPADKNHWLQLRCLDITSTDVAALFGISPYLTEFELWHRKKEGLIVEIEQNDRMKWGTRFEPAIAAGIAEDEGWEIRKMWEYIRIPELRIGSSFDYEVLKPTRGLLEIKNIGVDQFNKEDQWIVNADGGLEAPLHIEVQVQHEMLVADHIYNHIGAMVGGNQIKLVPRMADKNVHEAIILKVKKFWDSIDSNTPPLPNYAKDADFIQKLFGYAEPGKVFDARNDERVHSLMEEYEALNRTNKTIDTRKDEIKAEILIKIGDSEKVIGEGFSISAGVIGPAWIEAYEKKGYRMFKPNFKKNKSHPLV